jgi:hypothetical protein
MARVGVIVPCYRTDPQPLFASVAGSRHQVCWYIFVHGQDSRLRAKLDDFAATAHCRYFPYGINRGLARSWNEGVRTSFADGNDVTLIVNDDLFFFEGAFDQFVDYLLSAKEHQPEFGIVMTYGMEQPPDGTGLQRVLSLGACFAIGEAAVRKIGYFDENFWPAYLEDFDYHYRLGLARVPLLCDERTLLQHQRSATLRRDRLLALLHPGRLRRNEQYYRRKWGGLPDQETFRHPFDDAQLDILIGANQSEEPFQCAYGRDDLAVAASAGFLQQCFSEELLSLLDQYTDRPRRFLEWTNGDSTPVMVEYAKINDAEFYLSIDHVAARFQHTAIEVPKYSFLHFRIIDAADSGPSAGEGELRYITSPLGLGMLFDVILVAGRWQAECLLAAATVLAPGGVVIVHDEERARDLAMRQLLRQVHDERGTASAAALDRWTAARDGAVQELFDVVDERGQFRVLRRQGQAAELNRSGG